MLPLGDPRALDPALSGAKAANLARCAAAGFSVLPGFVVTTGAFDAADPGWAVGVPTAIEAAIADAWRALGDADQPLVVRSSSTVEDIGASSMAGQFLSLLGVVGLEALLDAVRQVQRSATGHGGPHSALGPTGAPGPPAPMAVLVQRQVSAQLGGVLFGLDPVSGDRQHILAEVVPTGPEGLVSGTVTAQRYLLGRRGRVIEGPAEEEGPGLLDRRSRTRLAGLAGDAADAFGRAQDVEWAIDDAGTLWMLQSRPVTAAGEGRGQGRLLGPGPVGETFPEPLRPLEEDLWLPPLRSGIEAALTATATVPRAEVTSSPLLIAVQGRVACDLELLGASPQAPSRWRMLDPRVGGRRAVSAWRIGRLRTVLPQLAAEMCRRVDGELAALPQLDAMSSAEVLEVVSRARGYLSSVHGHEVLSGALLTGDTGGTAAGVAMDVLRRGRALGLADREIVVRWPVVLALTAPRLGAPHELPPVSEGNRKAPGGRAAQLDDLPPREALRLRARWLQELTVHAVELLLRRMAASHGISAESRGVVLRLDELEDIVAGWPAPQDLDDRRFVAGPPLPSCFRLTPEGTPVPVRFRGAHRPGGRGASQGRAQGTVVHEVAAARSGDILVTRALDPRLAGWLPELGGVVSETGSVLSHLAILAREYRVPAVVGVHDAVQRFPDGTTLLVDGTTGEVSVIEGSTAEQGDAEEGGAA